MNPFDYISTFCNISGNTQALQACLQGFYNMLVALAIAIAFLSAIFGAFKYLYGSAINKQSEGKRQIINSIIGLAVIFITGTVLYWINPNIFNAELLVYQITNLQPSYITQEYDLITTESQYSSIVGGAPPPGSATQQYDGKQLHLGSYTFSPYDKSQLVTIRVFGGHPVQIHRGAAASLQRISQRWQQLGGNSFYRIKVIGGFRTEARPFTAHPYGLAVDINPDANPMQSALRTDMPQQFIKLFTDEGWGWGGNWRSKKDAMHFSKLPKEQGNGKLEL